MNVINVQQVEVAKNPHNVDVRKLYDADSAQAIHITLQAGESLKPHMTPVDVFFYILEGTIDVRVGDETIAVEKDHLVESPKGIVHCLSNNSTQQGRILVVKTPRPTAQAKLL
ncbi:mannose-6-phosphate isomerase-like protein (cupin superfamily) [Parabacteroides sp. PF5-5]|uniref:cupin domain-containing protein n=1 Tax=unclassified Parabacteroides TaxID=2649774 RepID=UPI00247561E2|nr:MULTISPECIES: cupin domain-containing protein [unclassified Parabacteroides]MDH6304033.1 mannose-6-phosphate isomerase-like protein (cupin superfamily) [Parabacteroides sp. PH5-39]MDH6315252.1 mannose-6-phosphate isomerase-like protein (cupin superfamily) [Parabacteroides sp. PF5-13]MDH6318912.1 mannose-6-phosphate isomerase-like protein (cupin superfamily) [Parabacteroides sp. PH5-13]MDH6322641.1 mannose-6-phosphate isomerase-like protein (cupin superfamily) [Parabacteroides sp. PH5-8]MDH6